MSELQIGFQMTITPITLLKQPALLLLLFVGMSIGADTFCPEGQYLKNGKLCNPCSPGFYCPGGVQTFMNRCSPGFFTGFGQKECTICEEGFKCPDPSKPPVACPTFQYSPQGATECYPCPKGTVCSYSSTQIQCQPGQICRPSNYADKLPCPAGFMCPTPDIEDPISCPMGYYSTQNSTQCSPCPLGFFCPNPSLLPVPCPDGTFQNELAQTQCLSCPRGYQCQSKNTNPARCELGQFSGENSLFCIDCPAGTFCPNQEVVTPQVCPKGFYSSGKQFQCTVCPEGYDCQDRMNLKQCELGFYSLIGMDSCVLCPPGRECASISSRPMPCSPGQFSNPGSTQVFTTQPLFRNCEYCPKGHFCRAANQPPAECALGEYQENVGKAYCKACPDGYTCQYKTESPVACDQGYFSDDLHQTCHECPAGFDCSALKYSQLRACPRGTYSLAEQMTCSICPSGFFCERPDQAPQECPDNTFSLDGQTYCTQCPPGYKCLDKKGKYKTKCLPGQYMNSTDNACTACPPGYACPSSQGGLNRMYECPTGSYSAGGMAECNVCPPGKFCPSTTTADVRDCPDGYISLGGATECQICPKNYECPSKSTLAQCPIYFYAIEGSGKCERCPDGKECKYPDQEEPQLCPAGYYIQTLDWSCQPCPFGHSCPQGAREPEQCDSGQYQNQMAADECKYCPPGYFSDTKAEYCTPAKAGYYASQSSLKICPANTYSDWGYSSCKDCEDGFLCPQGTEAEAGFAFGCPKGSYCVKGIQYPCKEGTFGLVERARTETEGCGDCPAGYYCLEGTDNYELYPCPRGYFCPLKTGLPKECPPGTFNDQMFGTSIADCQLCPMGHQCDEATTDQGYICQGGYFCPLGSAPSQYPCPAGTFGGSRVGFKDVNECQICPAGYYCPEGTDTPIPSPPGFYQPFQGIGDKQALTICPAKYYCPREAMTNFKGNHCSPGYFCPAGSSSSQQVACPQGTYSDSYEIYDAAHCNKCPKGFKCGEASTSNFNMEKCPYNQYCPEGTRADQINNCPAGTFGPYTNARSLEECIPCIFGHYCLPGKDPESCPKGHYCPESTKWAQQYPCPAGTFLDYQKGKVVGECKPCGSGNYCPQGSQDPIPCPKGQYNNLTNFAEKCWQCPAGSYCPQEGTATPLQCPRRKHSKEGEEDCTSCEVGHYCPYVGTTQEEKEAQRCPAGTFCYQIRSGTSNSIEETFGLEVFPSLEQHACSRGHYCPEGTTKQFACPAGTYNRLRGRKEITDCKKAEAGYFVDIPEQHEVRGECEKGHYCPEGSVSSKQVKCPIGTFRSITLGGQPSDCAICLSGSYCDEEALVEPLECPLGFYCPTGTIQPEACPEGTFGDKTGLTDSYSCAQCPNGYYCGSKGLTQPQAQCDEGYYCISGSRRPEPTDNVSGAICPAGGYCLKGALQPEQCPEGKFNMFQGGQSPDDCGSCWPGYYCRGSSLPEPTGKCWEGFYCDEGTVLPSIKSEPGYYAPKGSDQQFKCPRGTYNQDDEQSECKPCQAGYYCPELGTVTPQLCPQGHYCPSYDYFADRGQLYEKIACPAGTISNVEGQTDATDCQPCPAGKFCESDGSTTFTGECEAGFFCLSYSPSPIPASTHQNGYYGPCPAGFYCPKGVTSPQACPAGTFSSQTQAKDDSVCQVCLQGTYCPVEGLAEPQGPCEAGYYCPEGSTTAKAQPCEAGYYCPYGASHPITCPIGFFSELSRQGRCTKCPSGSYCVFGVKNTCPVGYICQ